MVVAARNIVSITFNDGVTVNTNKISILKNKMPNSVDICFASGSFQIGDLDPNSLYEINLSLNVPVVKSATVHANVDNHPNGEVEVYLPNSKTGTIHILNGSSGTFFFDDLTSLTMVNMIIVQRELQ